MADRSFPEAADGRPTLPMEPELWAAGCDLETAGFVAHQLAADGYTLVRREDQDALKSEISRLREALAPMLDWAKQHAAYAPEWDEDCTVRPVVRIGDLRRAMEALA